MKLVISGASGFLGAEIIRQAKEIPTIQPVAVTSKPENYPDLDTIHTNRFLDEGVSFDPDDVFINCLFPTNANGVRMADGLQKVYRMIRKAAGSNVGAIINISSQSVYPSERDKPTGEEDMLSLETPYAVGKYSSEAYTDLAFQNRPHSHIRLASLIGVGYEQRIINRMVGKALKGEKLTVAGGLQRYGFLDVRDAAAGLLVMAQSDPGQWESVYNLGRNGSISLLEIAEMIVKKLKLHGIQTEYVLNEGTDHRNSALNPEKFMHQFHWQPRISLEETIEEIIDNKMREV